MRLWIERVEQLVHARHGQRCDVHDLGLAALEQAGAMCRRKDADLGRDRTQIPRPATIDALALLDDALADKLLGQAADSLLDLLLAPGKRSAFSGELGDGLGRCGIGGRVAIGLDADGDGVSQRVFDGTLDCRRDLRRVVGLHAELQRRDRACGGDDTRDELALELDRILDPDLARFEATGQNTLVDLRCAIGVVREAFLGTAGLDHHDRDVAAVELTSGNDEFERGRLTLAIGGVWNPLAVLAEGNSHGADRAVERDAADHERCRSGIDREHVVRVLLVGAENGEHDLGLVAETVGEARAQGAVGEATGENGCLGRAALTAEERTGDLSGCICTLFDVDGEWEEVHPRAGFLGCVRCREDDGPANTGKHRSLRLLGKLARFERQGLVGTRDGTRHSYGISHCELLSAGRGFSHASAFGAEAGSQSAVSVCKARMPSRRPAEATDNRSSCPL